MVFYLCKNCQVEQRISSLKIEMFPQDHNGLLVSLDREFPVLIALHDGVGDVRVGGVGLVRVQRRDAAEDGQTRRRVLVYRHVVPCRYIVDIV